MVNKSHTPGDSTEGNMAYKRRHTIRNLDPTQIPVYLDPKNFVTWRNIRER
jgi:hypothetical protein